METAKRQRKVGLVLSGGGARAFAHIGVLRALERTDVHVDVVAGTSLGAILGAFHAAGYSADAVYTIARSLSWRDIIDFSLQFGFFKGEKLHAFLAEYLPSDFADLAKPLAVTTADVETGEEVVITEGDLITALRASSCYPGAFEPLQFRGRTLADGGIINNLPVEAAGFLDANFVVASDTTPPRRSPFSEASDGRWWERFIATMRFERRNPMVQMLLRSSDIMQSILTEMQYCLHPADVRVKHALPHVRVESFYALESIIELGEQEALRVFTEVGLLPWTGEERRRAALAPRSNAQSQSPSHRHALNADNRID